MRQFLLGALVPSPLVLLAAGPEALFITLAGVLVCAGLLKLVGVL